MMKKIMGMMAKKGRSGRENNYSTTAIINNYVVGVLLFGVVLLFKQ